jgi:hypothetical protein
LRALFVVTSTTPNAPRAPYTAVEEASLSTEMLSTSSGFIAVRSPSTPSIRQSADPPAPIDCVFARMLIDAERLGLPSAIVMFKPGIWPWIDRSR